MSCAHLEDTEDLALGLLTGDHAASARRHLASCDSCVEIYEETRSERSLFEARARLFTPPPDLGASIHRAVAAASLGDGGPSRFARVTRGLVAALGCAAAIVGLARLDHAAMGIDGTEPCEPTPDRASPEEPLLCAVPASGVISNGRALACVTLDRATCEERLASSARP